MEQIVAERPLSLEKGVSQVHMHHSGTLNSRAARFENNPSERWYPRRWTDGRGTLPNGAYSNDRFKRDRSPRPICRDYLRGSCSRGEACKYQHPESDGHDGSKLHLKEPEKLGAVAIPGNSLLYRESINNDPRTKYSSRGCRSRSPCRKFQNGRCFNGASCPYMHSEMTRAYDSSLEQQQVDRTVRGPGFIEGNGDNTFRMSQRCDEANKENSFRRTSFSGEHRNRSPCRNYQRGRCIFGASCKRLHLDNTPGRPSLSTQHQQEVVIASNRPGFLEGNRDATLRTSHVHGEVNTQNDLRTKSFVREPRNRSPCRNFLSGKCYRGTSCAHPHTVPVYDRTRYDSWSSQQHQGLSATPRPPNFSDSCQNMQVVHDHNKSRCLQEGRDVESRSWSSERQRSRSSVDFSGEKLVREVCLQFTKGRCNRGEFCRYLHGFHAYASSNWNRPIAQSGDCDNVEPKIQNQKGNTPVMDGRKCELSVGNNVNFLCSAAGQEDMSLWSRPFKRQRSRSRSPSTLRDEFRSRKVTKFDSQADLRRDRCYNVARFQYPDCRSYKYERPTNYNNGLQRLRGEDNTSVNPSFHEDNTSMSVAPEGHNEMTSHALQLIHRFGGSSGSNIAFTREENEAVSSKCTSEPSHREHRDEELAIASVAVGSTQGAAASGQNVLESTSTNSFVEPNISPMKVDLTRLRKERNDVMSVDMSQESKDKSAETTPTLKTYFRKKSQKKLLRSVSSESNMEEVNNDSEQMPTNSLLESYPSNPISGVPVGIESNASEIEKGMQNKKCKNKCSKSVSCETMEEEVINTSKQGMSSSSTVETSSSNSAINKKQKSKKKNPKSGSKQDMPTSSLVETSLNGCVTNVTVDNMESVLATTVDGTLLVGDARSQSLQSLPKSLAPDASKKLLVLDLNGILVDIVAGYSDKFKPDTTVSAKGVFKRPFCDDFLQFCFQTFNVGIWSSRNKKNVEKVVDFLMKKTQKHLLFCWDQSHCTATGFKTLENKDKPLVLKELKYLWDSEEENCPWEKRFYNETNTVLLDDSPYKALRNPPNTAIFPKPFTYKDVKDKSLGPGGDLRVYLERLAAAENVQKFIEENEFGQKTITKSHKSWHFYSKIVGTCTSEQGVHTILSS